MRAQYCGFSANRVGGLADDHGRHVAGRGEYAGRPTDADRTRAGAVIRELLFVFGAARIGTTYLEHLSGRWFDYGMGPEGTFVKPFAKRLRQRAP
jgi:hypothetical protein